MLRYVCKRLSQGFFVLAGVSFFCFLIFQYMGDPVLALVGMDATPAQIADTTQRLGLDRPWYEQYLAFIANVSRGDFGISYLTKTPALPLVLKRVPATMELAVMAMLVATGLGGCIGVLAAVRPHWRVSRALMLFSLAGISLPTFLIAILCIYLFCIVLGWLPPFGRGEVIRIGFWDTGLFTNDGWRHIVLPMTTLGLFQLSMSARVLRGEMMEVMLEDYIRTARAKGLSIGAVVWRHALKNALIPFVTIAGLQLGQLIAFSIVTETVFQWPGMGALLIASIGQNDQPVVVTYIMLVAVLFVLINLCVDILYFFLNPKISYV
ncbi:MAG: ABC transporter permease [Candidatus Accumulibacter sp.]|jgi:ABC-type dipeptide/oligopeptide/nickel transport system permease component|nr:ABC transporter permease [Accumulibacter sp.]